MDVFLDAPVENSTKLAECHESFFEVWNFLKEDERKIPIFPSTYPSELGLLEAQYDIDGLVIELETLESLTKRVAYLSLPHSLGLPLKLHWHYL